MFFRTRGGSSFAAGRELESKGNLTAARISYQAAIRTGDPNYAPRAAHRLGHLLQQEGDTEGALAAYQQAIDSGHRKEARLAEGAQALLLGIVLQQLSLDPPNPMNAAGVRAAYRWAVRSGRRDQAGRMAYRLGQFLQENGDEGGALAAYQQAIDSGDREYVGKAKQARLSLSSLQEKAAGGTTGSEPSPGETFHQGVRLERDGDTAGALTAYQQVIDSGDPEYVPQAACQLGRILEKQGDKAGARDAYRQGADAGRGESAATAADNLGRLLEKQGDVVGALAAYKRAEDGGYYPAASAIFALIQGLDTLQEARAAHQWAVKSGHHDAPAVAYQVGRCLEGTDVAGALKIYQQVIDSGHDSSTVAEDARDSLIMNPGRKIPEALSVYQWTLDFGDSEKKKMAAENLEWTISGHEHDVAEARKVYRWATDSGQLQHLPGVAHSLGKVFEQAADADTARVLYQQAIDSGDADAAPLAAFSLGTLREAQGDAAEARAAYQQALDSPDPQLAKTAAETLERVLLDQQDAAAARDVYQWASGSGHGDTARRAAYALGKILEGQGDTAGALAAYEPAAKTGYRRATKAADALRKRTPPGRTTDPASPASTEPGNSPEGLNNRERIGRGLEILASGLGPFTSAHLPPAHSGARDWAEVYAARDRERGRSAREYSLTDPRFQLRIVSEEQRALRGTMPQSARPYASELRDTGNRWAHGGAFSDDDADRALDTMARLLTAIGATDEADQVRKLR